MAGLAAIAAAFLFPAGLFWSQVINQDRPDQNEPAELRFFDRHAAELLGSSALRTVALLLLIPVALHLYRATFARKPDLNRVIAVMAVAGPLTLALGTLAHDIHLAFASADFTGRESQTIDDAEEVTQGAIALATVGLSIAGTLGLAFWFVLGSLNAMRVGLLSRFMGVIGIIMGPAFVLGFAPLILSFWLLGLGLLFLNRWPRGMPPAWESGEAMEWPSMGGRGSESAEQPGGSRNGEVDPVGPGVRKQEDEGGTEGGHSRG